MTKFKKALKSLLVEEQAQSILEYILMLSVLMVLLTTLVPKVIKPIYELASTTITEKIKEQMSSGLHHAPIGN